MPLNLLDLRLHKFVRNFHLGENCACHSHTPTGLVPRHQMHARAAFDFASLNSALWFGTRLRQRR
jgi:hypothetical protein